MTQKEAYCCLNCTASSDCCGACGECPECCKECEFPPGCTATAYYKDGVFYKDFISLDTSSLDYQIRNVDTNCSYGTIKQNGGIITKYSTLEKPGEECSVAGYSKADVNFCFEGYAYMTSYNGSTYSTEFLCGSYEQHYGDGDECVQYLFATGNTSCPNFNNTDDCPGFVTECNGSQCYPACNPTPCEAPYSQYRGHRSLKVIFVNQVKLYNAKGEIVDPTFIGASYDPCNPCATWDAGCHFFAS
jgi:hypothetical protein